MGMDVVLGLIGGFIAGRLLGLLVTLRRERGGRRGM